MIVIDRKPPCRIVAWHRVLCDNSIARNITLHLTIPKTLKTIESSQNVHCACTNKPRIRFWRKQTKETLLLRFEIEERAYVRVTRMYVSMYACMYVYVAYRLCSGLQQLHASCTHSKVSIHASTHTRYATPLYHTTWDEARRNKTRCDETKRDDTGRHGTRRDKTRRDEAIRHNATHHASASGEYIRAR